MQAAPLTSVPRGQIKAITSTSAASPTMLHTVPNGNQDRIDLAVRNTHSAALTFYFRVKDSATTAAWAAFQLPAASSLDINVMKRIMFNQLVDANGTGDLLLEGYASSNAANIEYTGSYVRA
jgi:hypothetical protein